MPPTNPPSDSDTATDPRPVTIQCEVTGLSFTPPDTATPAHMRPVQRGAGFGYREGAGKEDWSLWTSEE